jgi:hypothetical protein
MTRSWTGYLAGAAFALSAAAGGVAYAQSSPGDAQRDALHDAAQGDHTRIERRVIIHDGDRHGHMDQAEHLRTMLQLKPSQEPALAAYVAALKPDHTHERIVEMSTRDETKTTPQRLAEMEAHVAEQAAQAHAHIDATRKFYDQLEPSQKKVFDQLPMLMMGPMGSMMSMGPMKVMVNMDGMPPIPPAPPAAPRPPAPPRL